MPLAFGSDFPVEDPDPRAGLAAAETRAAPGGPPFQPEQRLSRAEALAAFTAGAAYAAFAEGRRGMVREGMDADLTLLRGGRRGVPAGAAPRGRGDPHDRRAGTACEHAASSVGDRSYSTVAYATRRRPAVTRPAPTSSTSFSARPESARELPGLAAVHVHAQHAVIGPVQDERGAVGGDRLDEADVLGRAAGAVGEEDEVAGGRAAAADARALAREARGARAASRRRRGKRARPPRRTRRGRARRSRRPSGRPPTTISRWPTRAEAVSMARRTAWSRGGSR